MAAVGHVAARELASRCSRWPHCKLRCMACVIWHAFLAKKAVARLLERVKISRLIIMICKPSDKTFGRKQMVVGKKIKKQIDKSRNGRLLQASLVSWKWQYFCGSRNCVSGTCQKVYQLINTLPLTSQKLYQLRNFFA